MTVSKQSTQCKHALASCFLRNAEIGGLATPNTKDMLVNKDGSWDVYFSLSLLKRKESNWIPIGEDFFWYFGCSDQRANIFIKSGYLRISKK